MSPLDCSVQPVPLEDAFVATDAAEGILYLGRGSDPTPLCLNVDWEILFNIRADRRVVGIEFLCRARGSLLPPPVVRQIASDNFHSLILLHPNDRVLTAEELGLRLHHNRADWIGWTFGHPENPARYWLGGGGFAEIERGALVGIGIQFQV